MNNRILERRVHTIQIKLHVRMRSMPMFQVDISGERAGTVGKFINDEISIRSGILIKLQRASTGNLTIKTHQRRSLGLTCCII